MHSANSRTSVLAYRPPLSPCSSVDDEEINSRVTPDWSRYRPVIESHGYRLDTVRDVKAFYEHYFVSQSSHEPLAKHFSARPRWSGYPNSTDGEDELCKDRGLVSGVNSTQQVLSPDRADGKPDNLFRGTRLQDGKKLIIKAVGMRSHELDVIAYLSSPTLRREPTNHTIPILDIIRLPRDDLAFIVQEEWSSSFAHSAPCSLRGVLYATRQCIEGLAFMHYHRVAHLDVSLSNILTNCAGSYAYIDFELSRRFNTEMNPMVRGIRGTELPPEIERGEDSCPFKVDIWALGVMILRACKAAGYDIVELLMLTQSMLKERPQDRPSAQALLQEFDRMFAAQDSRVLKRKPGAPIN